MPLRDYILDRFWLKLFSFVLATLIWFTVTSNQSETRVNWNPFRSVESRDYTRAVRVVTHPLNRKFFKVEPVEVTITVRGNTTLLDKLELTDIQPYVILTEAPEAGGPFPIKVKDVPRNLQVENVTPKEVLVEPALPN